MAEGRFFTAADDHDEHVHEDREGHETENFPVVLGSEVAQKTGLKLRDTFLTTHGLAHNSPESEQHQHAMEVVGILQPMNLPYNKGIFTNVEALWEAHGTVNGEITALMVTPLNYGGLMEMYQEINKDSRAQAALHGAVMGDLFSILHSHL